MPYRMFRAVACFCLMSAAAAVGVAAQARPVKVKCEVDGKELQKPVRIFFAAHWDEFKPPIIEPPVKDGGFVLPPELSGLKFDEVSVRVVCGKYTLEFTEVEVAKLTGELVFGVDYRPFDPENVIESSSPEGKKKKLAVVHYVRFIPEDGPPTRMIINTYR